MERGSPEPQAPDRGSPEPQTQGVRAMPPTIPQGWHSRGYLPHLNGGEIAQMVTFSLVGSLPVELVQHWKALLRANKSDDEAVRAYLHRIENYLEANPGAAWLSDPRIAELLEGALVYFHDQRYRLMSWVIMANHVHTLIVPMEPHDLSSIVMSWKNWSARRANALLGRKGAFWAADYFDRYIRNEEHLLRVKAYIERNPVRAGLCSEPEEWRWSSAYRRAGS
jgi:REP element-mobilizing transposase RayT